MTYWENVVAAALVGVHNRSVGTDDADPLIGERIAEHTADPVRRTLDTAALTAVARLASGPAGVQAQPIPAAPTDPRPPVSPTASTYVLHAFSLSRWMIDWCLDLLATSGRRPTGGLLTSLLVRTARDAEHRAVIATIVGPRGRWLADLAPELGAVLPHPVDGIGGAEPDPGAWLHGDLPTRVAHLTALRRRDPGAARELLEQSWPAEPGAERDAFIEVFAFAPTADDEAFLEHALDDRRRAVRAGAVRALDAIEGSALRQRIFAAAAPMLTVEKRRLGRPRLTVHLPERPGPALVRDGVDPTPPRGIGGASWTLRQLISRIDPTEWEAHFGRGADELVGGVDPEEKALVAGLCAAAVTYRAADWADALIGHPATESTEVFGIAHPERLLDHVGTQHYSRVLAALQVLPTPWPDKLCLKVFGDLIRTLETELRVTPPSAAVVDLLAVALPATDRWQQIVDDARARVPVAPRQLAVLGEALRIRSILTRELT
ncbi:DUF5691 domain-containing protein [Gordonia sp. NB41Y]|uniref:DUF5691 domain-containing protein n=1 Tax=Gordonia sp. NB41Y TaxID=875808 RepID=UPI0006B1559F|nr:DUF5691 domain-containing protein [Gordonia sp. NB41Y]EMP10919.2 hypothetical protein ISGA_4317 [Gordonia sp. NB41Y]WLP88778.1 DUF5691 domain-containing protein [Gordonia sp. NB41Y]